MASATITGSQQMAVRGITNLVGGLPLSVTWRMNGQPNIAEIQMPRKRFHEFRQYNAGKRIWVKIQRNYYRKTIFHGWLTGRYFEFSPDSETVTVIAQGPRWHLTGEFIKGRLTPNSEGDFTVLTGQKCIYNEVLENCTIAPSNGSVTKIDEGTYLGVRPFSVDPRDFAPSQAYTVNEILWYIWAVGRNWLSPTVITDCLTLTEFGIGPTLGNLTLYDLNIDGMNLTQAIDAVMRRAGLRWWCRPVSTLYSELKAFVPGPDLEPEPEGIQVGVTTPTNYKRVYLADVAAGVTPPASPTLANIGTSINNINAGRAQEDFASVANRVYCYGANKIYQQEFQLLPGWDDSIVESLIAQPIDTIRKETREKTSSNWLTYKYAGRLWILDEDGAVTGTVYPFDALFGHVNYALRKRPFLGERVDEVEIESVKILNPASGVYEKVEANIQLLPTKAGILIEGDELVPAMFDEETLIFASAARITLCVREDMALEKVANTPSAAPQGWQVGVISQGDADEIDRRQCIIFDSEYQTDNINTTKATTVEEQLEDLADRKLLERKDPRVSASFSIPTVVTSYEPGDYIYEINGRGLPLPAQVLEVRFELAENQRTELVLEDMRLAES